MSAIAQAIYSWADRTARIGSVEAVIDICQEAENKAEIFYLLPIEMVMQSLKQLEDQGKAQVFYSDNTDSYGVKFFHIWVKNELLRVPKILKWKTCWGFRVYRVKSELM